MIKQILNSVTTTYRVICQCLAHQLFAEAGVDLLATDKSRYFAQPRPIIVSYLETFNSRCGVVMATEF